MRNVFLALLASLLLFSCSSHQGKPYEIRPWPEAPANAVEPPQGGANTPPSPIRMPEPKYPNEAIDKRVEGEVVLRGIIIAQGRVTVYEVLQSFPLLDEAAIDVVENEWLFEPATKDGKPVAAVAELSVTFHMK